MVDSLRADHLSCYGYEKRTPNIDHLAEQGTRYDNAWVEGSYTAKSIPFILSEYLYYKLRTKGYEFPAVIHSNPIITRYLKDYDLDYANIDLHKEKRFTRLRNLWGILCNGIYRGETRADTINEQALRIINILEPNFFLCLWYMDVHAPFFPPYKAGIRDILLNQKYRKAILEKTPNIGKEELNRLIRNYDDEISYFDSTLWKLLKAIPEDTHIILTADHGEEFMEHGNLGHHDKNIPELRHVPLIIKSPHNSPNIIEEPFRFKDFDRLLLKLMEVQP